MTAKAVIFTLDEVLITQTRHAFFDSYFKDQGKTADILCDILSERCLPLWNLEPLAQSIETAAEIYPQYAGILSTYLDNYADTVDMPVAGTRQMLRDLRQAGVKIVIAADMPRDAYDALCFLHPQLKLADDVILSEDIGARLPDPLMFRAAAAKISALGMAPDETLFLTAAPAHAAAALKAGFNADTFATAKNARLQIDNVGQKAAPEVATLTRLAPV